MCGRFHLATSPKEFASLFDDLNDDWEPRYNIAPTDAVPVATADGPLVMRWGFQRQWSPMPLINARCETVASKATFAESFAHRRCLVPATGYYEWKSKRPHNISTGGLFAMAGVWELVDETTMAFTVITTQANSLTKAIHDRMPVILDPSNFETWLNEGPSSLLGPYPSKSMEMTAVSNFVNKVGNDGKRCIEPIDPDDGFLFRI